MRYGLVAILLGGAVTAGAWPIAPQPIDFPPDAKLVLELSRSDAIQGAAWSYDGSMLAAYSYLGGDITVWDDVGRVVQEMHRPGAPYGGRSLAFVESDQELVTPPASYEAGGVTLSVWDVRTGALVRDVPGPLPGASWRDNAAYTFALSPDQSVLALVYWPARAQPVALYSTRTWKAVGSLPDSMGGVASAQSLAFSRDGKLLAVGEHGGSVKVYDVATRTLVQRITAYAPPVIRSVDTLSFSPDGRMIVTGTGFGSSALGPMLADPVRVFRVGDGAKVASFPEDLTPVREVEWSPAGDTIALYARDKDLRLWHPFSATPLGPPLATRAAVNCLAFSPDGQKLAICNSNFLSVLSLQNP